MTSLWSNCPIVGLSSAIVLHVVYWLKTRSSLNYLLQFSKEKASDWYFSALLWFFFVYIFPKSSHSDFASILKPAKNIYIYCAWKEEHLGCWKILIRPGMCCGQAEIALYCMETLATEMINSFQNTLVVWLDLCDFPIKNNLYESSSWSET